MPRSRTIDTITRLFLAAFLLSIAGGLWAGVPQPILWTVVAVLGVGVLVGLYYERRKRNASR
jgi:hypothetical protein